MSLLVWIALVVALGVAFFVWANARTRRKHARFTHRDVEVALEEFMSSDSTSHDTWDLFRSSAIDDPYLESIRQRCRDLTESEAAKDQVRAMLAELRQGT